MDDKNNSPDCERAADLIAFLYNETDERETRDFENHLRQCNTCREEVVAFRDVRESVVAWRDEALAGFVATPLAAKQKRKSAMAALRQFFDLSPLWLKGATAFAVLAFCVLAVLVFKLQIKREVVVSSTANPAAVYTKQDVDRMVKEALAQVQPPAPVAEPVVTAGVQKPEKSKAAASGQMANNRRPLSRAEREQLAADLRLLSTRDDDLDLLGDRINR
jgi:anti-sigma factor RsiW